MINSQNEFWFAEKLMDVSKHGTNFFWWLQRANRAL